MCLSHSTIGCFRKIVLNLQQLFLNPFYMKKKLLLFACLAGMMGCQSPGTPDPAIPRDEGIEKQVETTLKKMSLDEKIGQMVQLTFDAMKYTNRADGDGVDIDEAHLDSLLKNYKVGSFLNTPNGAASTKEQWQRYLKLLQDKSLEHTGVPTLFGLDQNHGTTYTAGGTMFPQNINVAASFNTEMARKTAEITAYETRACSVPWTFSPTLDLSRDQRWPRQWEDYGEDPYLSSRMAEAVVKGFQGEDPNHIDEYHIATTPKHYMGYGVPVSGKDRTPAIISPQDLREKFFAPFKAAILAGGLSVMVNSASINGLPVHADRELLTGWLKEELNWDGVIVTDWADINNLYTREKVAKDKKEALRLGINAGIDMIMEPYQCDVCGLLKELVAEGAIPQSRIDDAARRILRLKYRLGLGEKPLQDVNNYPKFGGPEFAEVALHSAEESMVLLKNNDGLLPLKQGTRILVTGPNANQMRCLLGGWSYTWQGSNSERFTEQYNTIYEALQNKFGSDHVKLAQGVTYKEDGAYWEENTPNIAEAVSAARSADVIVACVGENSYCETPGNLSDLTLSDNQRNLVKELARTGKPIVLVLNEGRPRIIKDIEPLAASVVDIMLPGNYGGDALANLLAGDANFSGRLPMTYPKEVHSLITYDYKPSQEVDKMEGAYDYNAVVSVQWAFGYGLSYTTFAYSDLKVSTEEFGADDVLTVSVTVTNTGQRAGKESVLLFSSDLLASLIPDVRRLRAFDKIELQPGESRQVELKLPAKDLAFVGADGKWILEEGDFRLQIGDQTVNIRCRETRKWDSPNI